MKPFTFATNQVPIYNAALPLLKKHGYQVWTTHEDLERGTIERGVTLTTNRRGDVGIAYYMMSDAEYTRLDELLVALESDDPASFSLAQEAVLEMEFAMEQRSLDALLSAVPALKTFLEETKSLQKGLDEKQQVATISS
jgi:hypothetical protein